jgi:hypothetical protein
MPTLANHLLLCGLVATLGHRAAAQAPAVPLDSLRAQASRTLHAKRYAEAAALFQQEALAERLQSSKASAYYNLACAQALGGQPQAALRALGQAQRLGFNGVELLRTDTDLTSLRDQPEFAAIASRMERQSTRLAAQQADPRHAKLVTSDITHFWQAYDQAAKDTAHAAAIYQRAYFDKGSVGLQDYYQAKIGTTERFVANQRAKPAFYRAIRPNTLRIATLAPQIQAGFQKLKELYPEARFPNVYFVIGRWSSAGTSTENGMIIGADQLCRTPDTPLGELNLWARNNFGALDMLPIVVAHEHIHYIQKQSGDATLLRGALNEGMADFLAELTTGRNPNGRLQAYGLAHEKEIWADFSKEMNGTSWRNWIANGGQETAEKPADLGYFVGYRICQSYYQEMADKQQAVHDILNIANTPAFLAKSRYAEKLAAR